MEHAAVRSSLFNSGRTSYFNKTVETRRQREKGGKQQAGWRELALLHQRLIACARVLTLIHVHTSRTVHDSYLLN